jgi:hypothetical protein
MPAHSQIYILIPVAVYFAADSSALRLYVGRSGGNSAAFGKSDHSDFPHNLRSCRASLLLNRSVDRAAFCDGPRGPVGTFAVALWHCGAAEVLPTLPVANRLRNNSGRLATLYS